MSLRARLLVVIGLALLVSFATATGLAAWRDARLVRDEVGAALQTSRQEALLVVAGLAARPRDAERPLDSSLERFVAGLDNSRHVQATLLGADGAVVLATHTPRPRPRPPHWFMAVIAPLLPTVTINLPSDSGFATLLLVPRPESETGERWVETRDSACLLGLLSLLTGVLCWITVAHGLSVLRPLAAGLQRLGAGDRASRLPEAGPPELAALAASFNRMAARLGAAEDHNRRLQAQLLRVAEEERAEIARDLHDEVGPLLFAITTYAATIDRLNDAEGAPRIGAQVTAIREAVTTLQGAVRSMLRRLRDEQGAAPDLGVALDGLLRFWRQLRPETTFELVLDMDPGCLTDAQHAALFRVAQEGVSNAVRHGTPARVTVALAMAPAGVVLRVSDDGGGGEEGHGYGLAGMRERLGALGGRLEVRRDPGWTLTASAPRA